MHMIISKFPAIAGASRQWLTGRHRKSMAAKMVCVWMLLSGISGQSLAADPSSMTDNEFSAESEVKQLLAGQDTDQLILAVGDGTGSSRVQVTYYQKSAGDEWEEIFSVPGYCGHGGITGEKKEGDRKTPAGAYSFSMAFGIYEDPGSVLPYHQVDRNDYWVDDSSSSYYNQLVDAAVTPVSWNSAEHLINVVPQYHYGLVIDYNKENIPGKGSAIFLHGYHSWKTWTEGCIAIPEENVRQLIQAVDGDTKIIMAAGEAELKDYY